MRPRRTQAVGVRVEVRRLPRRLAPSSTASIAMWSRNELDLAPRFPAVAAALSKLKDRRGGHRRRDRRARRAGRAALSASAAGRPREISVVFDILWLDGQDLRKLHVRRAAQRSWRRRCKRTPAGDQGVREDRRRPAPRRWSGRRRRDGKGSSPSGAPRSTSRAVRRSG